MIFFEGFFTRCQLTPWKKRQRMRFNKLRCVRIVVFVCWVTIFLQKIYLSECEHERA